MSNRPDFGQQYSTRSGPGTTKVIRPSDDSYHAAMGWGHWTTTDAFLLGVIVAFTVASLLLMVR